jgi:Cu+-exporting ATPase
VRASAFCSSIEVLRSVDTLVVDKTGTLTEGKPRLSIVDTVESYSQSEMLGLAASVERLSEHPLSVAIVEGARERGASIRNADRFESVTGKGLRGTVDGHEVVIGNRQMLGEIVGEDSPLIAELGTRADALEAQGHSVVFVAVDGAVTGLLGMKDELKSTTAPAIAQLRRDGLRVIMLTGDSERTARAVGEALELDEVVAGVLPADKAEYVRSLKAEGAKVAMAGDGINDAPALALADVGIAMGTGTDVAMESAGVTLVRGDLNGIVRARKLSQATMRNIKQNLFFAFVYNAVGVPIAGGILYPWFGILLSPMIAAAAMSLSSVSVIGNALRLNREKL